MNALVNTYLNFRGFRSKRKLVVFESDDWGTIRMPNKASLQRLSQKIPKISKSRFAQLDSIANVDDLSILFETLTKYKDVNGKHPVLTANVITGNPDFSRIKAANFENYYFEKFSDTISRLPKGDRILELWKTGYEKGLFYPQLHGREHVHVPLWLKELRNGNTELLAGFEESCFGIPYESTLGSKRPKLMQALDHKGIAEEIPFQEQAIKDATHIFKEHFGFASKSFIAPNYHWHHTLEPVLKQHGIQFMQGIKYQFEPRWPKAKVKKKLHHTGQKNKNGQYYILRNAFFEPCGQPEIDNVGVCLSRVANAFRVGAPAVIGTHRINFIGSLSENNRTENIKAFDELLKRLTSTWPDIEFITTDKLGELIQVAQNDSAKMKSS